MRDSGIFEEEGKFNREFDETREFMNFIERTGRKNTINEQRRTSKCIHVLKDFAATATYDHPKRATHLRDIDRYYKPFRVHALKCNRCRLSLEAIFSFTGHNNRDLFMDDKNATSLLKYEREKTPGGILYVSKIITGMNANEITYITNSSIKDALAELQTTRTMPLKIRFREIMMRKKTPYRGQGPQYFQLYLYTLSKAERENLKGDKKYTKVCIRSLRKD